MLPEVQAHVNSLLSAVCGPSDSLHTFNEADLSISTTARRD